jgi:prepilin-type N-terminal cleavage/methylation domain-containing protein
MTIHVSGFRSEENDEGFGLVEIIVSMFILALVALALLPLLIQGVRQSAINTTQATATQLLSTRMQLLQSMSPVCTDVAGLAGTSQFTDPRGVVLEVTTTVGTCVVNAATVTASASVVRLDTSTLLASADTIVYVGE